MGDSPLLPVVSADPIAPPGFRPHFPATYPVLDIFADFLWVTTRNDTGDTDNTDNTNSASDMDDMDDKDDTDTWASYKCESTAISSDKFSWSPRSSDEFESTAGYLILIIHARHTGDCFHERFVVGVLMIRCNKQGMISAERDLVFPTHARHIGVCFPLPFVVGVLMTIRCTTGRVISAKKDQFPNK